LCCHRHHGSLHPFPTRRSSDLGCSVTYRVEDVCTLTYFFWKFTHFGNSTRIIRDRSESVDSKLHCSSCHHRRSGDRDSVESGKLDRKSTRLNSSHVKISYAVFC